MPRPVKARIRLGQKIDGEAADAEIDEAQILSDADDVIGHQHDDDDHGHGQLAAPEFETGKAVADHGAGSHLDDADQQGQQAGVAQRLAQI